MAKTIPLTKGYVALVDDEDYERVSALRWCATVKLRRDGSIYAVYAVRYIWHGRGNKKDKIFMHRFLVGGDAAHVDHINGDGLDNRRSNLRPCSASQNQANSKLRRDNTSGYKGVFRSGAGWSSSISVKGKQIHLGRFKTKEDAAAAYAAGAEKYFGEFANPLCSIPGLAVVRKKGE